MKLTSLNLGLLLVILLCTVVSASGNSNVVENLDDKESGLLAMTILDQIGKILKDPSTPQNVRTKLRDAVLKLPVPPPPKS